MDTSKLLQKYFELEYRDKNINRNLRKYKKIINL